LRADAIAAAARPVPEPGDLCDLEQLTERLAREPLTWLILDYDGTLADFAPTPEHVLPDPALIRLLSSLVQYPNLALAAVSGRALGQVRQLIPVAGVLLAGSYGIELQTPGGELVERMAYSAVRPAPDALKPQWAGLVSGRAGFFLEDKGWTLAIHGRLADERAAAEVLARARVLAQDVLPDETLGLLAGDRFLEACPRIANKGPPWSICWTTTPGREPFPSTWETTS